MERGVILDDLTRKTLIDLAQKAGKAILKVYEQQDLKKWTKKDNSPVTEADILAHEIILSHLEALKLGIPVISEESTDLEELLQGKSKSFWLVDPLDGTKEFLKKNGEFSVNIALVENGNPVFGVIDNPVFAETYWGGKNLGSFKNSQPIETNQPSDIYTLLTSRSHLTTRQEQLIKCLKEKFPHKDILSSGSSRKFCLIAEGKGDLYPRLGPTYYWDTAAGQAILQGAGGEVVNSEFEPLRYELNQTALNPEFWVLPVPPDHEWVQKLKLVVQEFL